MQVYPRAPLVFMRYQESFKAQIVVINLLVLNRRKSGLEKTTDRVRGFANTVCLPSFTVLYNLQYRMESATRCSNMQPLDESTLCVATHRHSSAVIVAITCSSNRSTIVQDTKFTGI